MMKEEILKKINEAGKREGYNSMGASESWYDKYFMVREFAKKKNIDLKELSVDELNRLLELADFASDIFY